MRRASPHLLAATVTAGWIIGILIAWYAETRLELLWAAPFAAVAGAALQELMDRAKVADR